MPRLDPFNNPGDRQVQENTARAETSDEAQSKMNEAAVTRLSSALIRVCNDAPKFDVRLSALVDALGSVIVEYAHNDEGVLIMDDVVSIRNRIQEYVGHGVTRHTLARIAKDPTTVGSCCGEDELSDLIDAMGGAKHDKKEHGTVRGSVHAMPPHIAAALASLFGRDRR